MQQPRGSRLAERCPECQQELEIDLVIATGQHGIMLYDVACRTCFWSDQRNTVLVGLHLPETEHFG